MNDKIYTAKHTLADGTVVESRTYRAKAPATQVANWWAKKGYRDVEVVQYRLEPEARYPVK